MKSRHRKRKIALAAALVGALVLPLCSCSTGGIEGKALKYLASRYSGEFTITDSERIANQTGEDPSNYLLDKLDELLLELEK